MAKAPPGAERRTADTAPAAAARMKKKGVLRHDDPSLEGAGAAPAPAGTPPLSATAQVQTDLLATASDLYRRIEADPGALSDDDAYWTSLPAHLRTFIRNALPLGQLPDSDGGATTPGGRAASTQAMIAVAQQLAQAAHASQRFSPGSDAELLDGVRSPPGGRRPLGPTPGMQAAAVPPSQDGRHGPLVLVNELEEDDEYGYASEGEFDGDEFATEAFNIATRLGEEDAAEDAMEPESAPKKKKKKKKKAAGATATANAQPALPPAPADQLGALPRRTAPPADVAPPVPLPKRTGAPARPAGAGAPAPPPSSRAAGKLPMSFPTGARMPPPRAPRSAPRRTPSTRSGGGGSSLGGAGRHHALYPPNMPGAAPPASGSTLTISSAEEREQVARYWQRLAQRERRALVDQERAAVQRKLREFQKHACGCTVCTRKRAAIDTKLQELYDTYYDTLEAGLRPGAAPAGGPGPFPGSVALDKNGSVLGANLILARKPGDEHVHPHPPPGARGALAGVRRGQQRDAALDNMFDEDLEEEDYDDEYDDEYDEELDADLDEDAGSLLPRTRRGRSGELCGAGDCYCINSSLTVRGILAVADDLSGNEAQKLILMMEQLADHRLDDGLRQLAAPTEEPPDVSETGEVELSLEEQREQGWRMFQIFAARIMEQRVLQAYRENLAQERQLQLLRELEEEESNEKAREAKRAKENQRKKDKKRQLKLQKEEERLRREQERAAGEAAARAEVERQKEEQRRREAEQRRAREEERRAREEERRAREEEQRRREAEQRRAREEEQRRREAERRRQEERRQEERRQEERRQEERRREERQRQERAARDAAEREKKSRQNKERQRQRKDAKDLPKPAPASPAAAKREAHTRSASGAARRDVRSPPGAATSPTSPSAASPVAASPAFAPLGFGLPRNAPAPVRRPSESARSTPVGFGHPGYATPPGAAPSAAPGAPGGAFDAGVNSASASFARMGLGDFSLGSLGTRVASPIGAPSPRASAAAPRAAPGPIGPIERPRRQPTSEWGPPEAPGARLPEGILGSAALGGDDELVEPRQPRRMVQNTVAINSGPGAGAGSYLGSPGSGSPAFQHASPWPAAPYPPAPVGAGYAPPSAAPGPLRSSSPWRAGAGANGWDRARYAFEQSPAPLGGAPAPGADAFAPGAGQNALFGMDLVRPKGGAPGSVPGAPGGPGNVNAFAYPSQLDLSFGS